MDQEVTEFFNTHSLTEHNKDALAVPTEFIGNLSDDDTRKFFKWIRHTSQCKSLKLGNYDTSVLKEELSARVSLAIPHRGHPGWRSITLYGYSSIMTNSYEYYKQKGIISDSDLTGWTDICKFFPNTVEWIKQNSPLKEYARVRVMILEPGGSSSPHRDYEAGQALCGPINVAVSNPPGAEFALENGGLVPWQEGDIRSMDLGSYHCIRNTGSEPRIHLIITPSKTDWDIDAMRIACSKYLEYQEERNDARRT